MFFSGKDMMGRDFHLESRPTRIISLVPSITETLSVYGLEQEVIGITKFCIHPSAWFQSKKRIGGTKNPDLEIIKNLNPDLILANKEENRKEDIEELEKHFPVFVTDVNTLEQNGQFLNIMDEFWGGDYGKQHQHLLKNFEPIAPKHRVLYFIWKSPWMVAGPETYINDLLEKLGFVNACQQSRYPVLTSSEIVHSDASHLLFSSEPFPFKEKHWEEIKALDNNIKCHLVDGEMFSWFGTRIFDSIAYFKHLIHHQIA